MSTEKKSLSTELEHGEHRILWQPQPKQAIFMSRFEDEVLYGGAAGGGKSDALVAEALRQVDIPYYRGLIVRRTYPQLEDLIGKTYKLYPAAYPGARYNSSTHTWKFPSGAVIIFGSCQHDKDKYNFQGKPYDFIGFDELTQFTYEIYDYLAHSRNRPNGPGTRVYVRATANPGGVGHAWVKERFITAGKPLETVWRSEKIKYPDGHVKEEWMSSTFVPSTVFDNQQLLKNDPKYLMRLASMPEAERNALLYGSWDSFDGQVFREWRDDSEHYVDGKWTHVIKPFMPPQHWLCIRAFDFGYTRPFSVGWYVADEQGKLYRIREYYGCTGTPNHGLQLNPVEIAKNIREIEDSDPLLKGRQIIGVADPSIFDRSRGQSVAELMEQPPYYVAFSPGDNTRLAGLMQVHYRFAFDQNGDCMLQIFNTCKNFIRTIPALVYDDANVEDVDTDMEDHIFDELKYCLMERIISPRKNVLDKEYDPMDYFDPLNQRADAYRPYGVFM